MTAGDATPTAMGHDDVPRYRHGGLLGNMRALSREPVELLLAAHEACGDVARLPLAGPLAAYSFRHPDAVRDVLVDVPQRQPDSLVKGRTYTWVRRDVGPALLNSDLGEHAWRRALLNPEFAPRKLGQRTPIIERSVAQTAERLEARVGTTVDLFKEIRQLGLRVMGEMLFGFDFTRHAERFAQLYLQAEELLNELMGRPSQYLPAWMPTPLNGRLRSLRAEVEFEFEALVGQRSAGDAGRGDILERMLAGPAETNGGTRARRYRTREEVLGELKGLLGAGYETTASLITWTLYFVAACDDVDARLADELEREVGDRPVVPADLPRLAYGHLVMLEALRLMPPAWGFLREATTDVTIAGTHVPARSFVVMSPYVTHRDARWYPDPLRFDPDRHRDASQRPRYAYYPFGFGHRSCIGRAMGELEAQLTVAELLRRFRFRIEPMHFVRPVNKVTIQPQDGLHLRVQRR